MTRSVLGRDEILEVYARGPEAVVALVQQLGAQVDWLEHQLAAAQATAGARAPRRPRDSQNSSAPPSTDSPRLRRRRRRRRAWRRATGRRPGGQPGHPGHTLAPAAHPDQRREYRPACCAGCQRSFPPDQEPVQVERRQVCELPPLRLVVTEHGAASLRCAGCGQITAAPFPPGVTAPVQYGPGLLSLVTYLQIYQLLPLARIHQLCADLWGRPISEAVLVTTRLQAAQRLASWAKVAHWRLCNAPVVHFDETGLYVGRTPQWLHTASTTALTYYAVSRYRGRKAMEAGGILPQFTGIAVHDALASYFQFPCAHALCNAHLLRELTYFVEDEPVPWARPLQELLAEMEAVVATARQAGATHLSPQLLRAYRHYYGRFLAWGLACHPEQPQEPHRRGRAAQCPARNLLLRLRDHREAVLRFLTDFQVPFDNNLAERDLRMLKVQQKISGCFRSESGAAAFCRIRAYISTSVKQGHTAFEALHALFTGRPFLPT